MSLTLDQRMEQAMAALEELRATETHARWSAERFNANMDEGLKRFDTAFMAAEARIRELEKQVAAAATATPTVVRGKTTRDEEVARFVGDFPHIGREFLDETGKVHQGLKRQAERLTDAAIPLMKVKKMLPSVTDEDVAMLGPEHDGLRRAIAATTAAVEEGEEALRLQSRELVWAVTHGWSFVEDMAAPDAQLTRDKEEEKRYKELVEQRRKAKAEAQAAKAAKAALAGGRGGGRYNRWGGGRGRGRYDDWRERERHDRWGAGPFLPRDDRWGSPGGYEDCRGGGGRGGPFPPPFGAGRGGRGGR